MTRLFLVPMLLGLAACSAAAQDFSVDTVFRAISISGFDVQKVGMTLKVTRAPSGRGLVGSGHAGCNSYTAAAVLRDEQIDFSEVVTTRKLCGKPRMKSEDAFLTSLKSARRWRQDGQRLILEGEAARLLMTSAPEEPKAKAPDKTKPGKKAAKKPPARR